MNLILIAERESGYPVNDLGKEDQAMIKPDKEQLLEIDHWKAPGRIF